MPKTETLDRTTFIRATIDDVFEFFSNPYNLAKITPSGMGFRILSAPERSLAAGDRIVYRIRINGLPMRWVTLIEEWEPGHRFVDVQEDGPYAFWRHTHSFAAKAGGVEMSDHVEYRLPLGLAGRVVAGWFVRRQLRAIFDFREEVIARSFPVRS